MSPERKSQKATTRRRVIVGLTMGAGAAAVAGAAARRPSAQEISRTLESIHQEVQFAATPERVYAALIDEKQFQQVVLLGDAVRSGMVKATPPAQISAQGGGAFSIFGGFITGRQIELVANARIVQAWRPADWAAGVYSIARFDLARQGSGTRMVFEHTGFPKGAAKDLAHGWKMNYWQPLAKFLA